MTPIYLNCRDIYIGVLYESPHLEHGFETTQICFSIRSGTTDFMEYVLDNSSPMHTTLPYPALALNDQVCMIHRITTDY